MTEHFTQEQVNFMTGVTETLIACRWEDDEAFAVAPDVLTDWEYAEINSEATLTKSIKPNAESQTIVARIRHSTNITAMLKLRGDTQIDCICSESDINRIKRKSIAQFQIGKLYKVDRGY